MTYGARVWGPTGLLELDETSFTVRIIFSTLVSHPPATTSVFYSIPGCDPATCNAVCVPVAPYPQDPNAQDFYAIQQEPQVLDGGVRVWFVNRNISSSASPSHALATQRLMVMRYK